MRRHAPGEIAVIFVSRRTAEDDAGYAEAAARMDALAAVQPGYRGVDRARDADGVGITVSYWVDEAAALAWRAQAEHAAIRETGRARWYRHYHVVVAEVRRDYSWERPETSSPAP